MVKIDGLDGHCGKIVAGLGLVGIVPVPVPP